MEVRLARKKTGGPKPFVAKKTTITSKKHRFEPFSQRIARLKIDPIRRPRGRNVDESDLSSTTSYFRSSLEHWLDLNLSEDFDKFSKQVQPLCDSLAQIVHHEATIIDLLLEYIGKATALSAEPLLDLISHFAHDLGARFEKHFARTVATVNQLAAKHSDVEVIEWSFTCLAWLFKYLSKLLVPDLRPLYDLMAPLLGKERQKPFVSRFAAEALSFLLRRASVAYHKDKEPLQTIVSHIFSDLCTSGEAQHQSMYENGVMTLFTEAIKGVNGSLSSGGDVIFHEVLSCVFNLNDADPLTAIPAIEVLRGVLTSTLHFTNSGTFKPILDIILVQVDPSKGILQPSRLSICMQMTTLAITENRGSKIEEWSVILRSITSAIAQLVPSIAASYMDAIPNTLAALAVAHQACPVDVAISHTKLFDTISTGLWQSYFLGFCNLYADLGKDRFQSFLLPCFQRYATDKPYTNRLANPLAQIHTLQLGGEFPPTLHLVAQTCQKWCSCQIRNHHTTTLARANADRYIIITEQWKPWRIIRPKCVLL